MLTKDQAFDINEFIFKNSHESLWRVGDKLEKILSEFAINPDKDKIINRFLSKHGTKQVHMLNKPIFALVEDLMKVAEVVEENSELTTA
jgi:hypothetical protein